MVANSELAIERGDFDKALHILGDVPPESPAYVRVQVPLTRRTLTLCRGKRCEKAFNHTMIRLQSRSDMPPSPAPAPVNGVSRSHLPIFCFATRPPPANKAQTPSQCSSTSFACARTHLEGHVGPQTRQFLPVSAPSSPAQLGVFASMLLARNTRRNCETLQLLSHPVYPSRPPWYVPCSSKSRSKRRYT